MTKSSQLFSVQKSELTYLLNYIGNEDSNILKFIDFFFLDLKATQMLITKQRFLFSFLSTLF